MAETWPEIKADGISSVHIHAPPTNEKRLHRKRCPDCKRARAWFASFFQEWYGWRSTCLHCGRSFEGGEWLALPFMRGSRAAEIARAKARYRNVKVIPLKEPRNG